MVAVQSSNVAPVNEALNEIYVEEEDYDGLQESIDMHDNFDQRGLAQKVEKHELLEKRHIAACIYKKAGRWKQSTVLAKKDNLYKDAMETCSLSGDREVSEELLVYFIEQFIREYTCKVDELVKDKIEALIEVKAKERMRKRRLLSWLASYSSILTRKLLSISRIVKLPIGRWAGFLINNNKASIPN